MKDQIDYLPKSFQTIVKFALSQTSHEKKNDAAPAATADATGSSHHVLQSPDR